ncbi:glycosyl transferase family 39 [Thioalkalivibrio denitrificans]|uniref:Glycosyl transferase family 39 n=1 Tax=Thioalkalivibrio denitrificans TaxID=108003 RepID=A0A1V3NN74_9GAMM|nr:glycosyltransferase family 39 protein [Thioalkalivibrio denitrificans]OOG26403.1 glycosyl transferase family 39 [Thioalkalivibrio denitrificans]
MSEAQARRRERRYWAAALAVTALYTAYRLILLATFPYDLYGDEAQYWTWAQAPDWGYFSKPPVIAWLITFTTAFCGDSHFCIKLGSPLLHAGTGLVLFAVARRLFDARTGFWVAALYGLMPAISLSTMVISTDAPLLFFWAVGLYALLRALGEGAWRWWLLAGLALGLGMMSKYNMVIFFVSALLFVLATPRHRHWITSPRPWVAGVLAGVVYLPNLLWNAATGFVSYRHTQDISRVDEARWSFDGLIDFVVSQFGVFGPILFAVLLFLLVLRLPGLWSQERPRFLLAFVLPWLAIVAAISLASRVHANWAAPIYLTALILVCAWLLERGRVGRLLLAATVAIHLLIAGGLYHYDTLVRAAGVELTGRTDPFKRVRGWSELGAAVEAVQAHHPDALLMTQERFLTAQLMYYVEPRMQTVVKWNPDGVVRDHYDLITSLEGREGQDFLFLRRPGPLAGDVAQRFRAHERVAQIRIDVHRDWGHHYDVYLLEDYQGAGED